MAVTVETQTRDADDGPASHRTLLNDLLTTIQDQPAEWQKSFIATIAAWPVENETVYGETFHYFIGGEAFNWKRLAERIATQLAAEGCDYPETREVFDWIATSGTFGGLSEEEFRRILGVDGWRAHLNHFYGVHIEQCLLAAIQSRIQKERFSGGMPPSDDASDRAYMGLYEGTEHELWQSSRTKTPNDYPTSSTHRTTNAAASLSTKSSHTGSSSAASKTPMPRKSPPKHNADST